jgi:hypothetical protein
MPQPDEALAPAPENPLDSSGQPRWGAYRGSVGPVDLTSLEGNGWRAKLRHVTQLKKWQFAMITTPEVIVSFVMADLGYATNGFCFAADRAKHRLMFDHGVLGMPGLSILVGNQPGAGARSWFNTGETWMSFERSTSRYLGALRMSGPSPDAKSKTSTLDLHFTLETEGAPEAVTLVVPVQGGIVNVTQKWAALPCTGALVVDGHRYTLDGGFAGLDWTHGLLGRDTTWKWAFASGRTQDGRPIGFNLGEGFNAHQPGENALWLGSAPGLLPDPHFTYDPKDPAKPWQIRDPSGAIDLEFQPDGVHREFRNLIIAKSRFLQVAGQFRGHIRTASGETVQVEDLPGVVEDQAIRW